MPVLTVDIPKTLQTNLNRDKRRTGLSKSFLVRKILEAHYTAARKITVRGEN